MYDIFISCKSEDYTLANEIYLFLCQRGYSVFIADIELRKLGRDRFGKVIDEALEEAKHLVLFSSNPNYVVSTYVEDEWRIFLEERRCGRKSGNILTVRKGFEISELPIALRNLQSFTYENFHSIIDYLPLSFFDKSDNEIDSTNTKSNNKYKSIAEITNNGNSVFKLYSNKNCVVYHGKNTIGKIEAYSEEPYYWFVGRKGEYRLRSVSSDNKTQIQNCKIDNNEEKIVHFFSKRQVRVKWIYILGGIVSIFLSLNVLSLIYIYNNPNSSINYIKSDYYNDLLLKTNAFDSNRKVKENSRITTNVDLMIQENIDTKEGEFN